MGVSGCGKSSLARALAQALQRPLIEGDDFHPEQNLTLMRQGIALTDADRAGWLQALGQELGRHSNAAVLSCSALKRAYRDQLRAAAQGLRFVHLVLSESAALARVQQRGAAHFFSPQLVRSQFETLESPADEPGVLSLDATQPLHAACQAVLAWLKPQ